MCVYLCASLCLYSRVSPCTEQRFIPCLYMRKMRYIADVHSSLSLRCIALYCFLTALTCTALNKNLPSICRVLVGML